MPFAFQCTLLFLCLLLETETLLRLHLLLGLIIIDNEVVVVVVVVVAVVLQIRCLTWKIHELTLGCNITYDGGVVTALRTHTIRLQPSHNTRRTWVCKRNQQPLVSLLKATQQNKLTLLHFFHSHRSLIAFAAPNTVSYMFPSMDIRHSTAVRVQYKSPTDPLPQTLHYPRWVFLSLMHKLQTAACWLGFFFFSLCLVKRLNICLNIPTKPRYLVCSLVVWFGSRDPNGKKMERFGEKTCTVYYYALVGVCVCDFGDEKSTVIHHLTACVVSLILAPPDNLLVYPLPVVVVVVDGLTSSSQSLPQPAALRYSVVVCGCVFVLGWSFGWLIPTICPQFGIYTIHIYRAISTRGSQ